MSRLGLVDQDDLLQWADTKPSQSEFPRLIRRLILETGVGVVRVGFAAGSGTASGGWDGTAVTTGSSAFVPAGLSVWELSVGEDVTDKPDEDFNKRHDTPDGRPTTEGTYLEVILRRWTKRDDWARDKAKLGRWKDVVALGVDAIETWLETAPVTHAWISERLGRGPYGLLPAETWWEGWSQETSPTLTPGVVLAGRDDAVTALRNKLTDPPQITTMTADSEEDVLAFIAAFAEAEVTEDSGVQLARTAFVDDVVTWRALRDHKSPLVLVPRSEATRAEAVPGCPHHVIVPVAGNTVADIVLPPLDSGAVKSALEAVGLDEKRADEAGRLARRSLKAMRRRLAIKPELHQPSWAHPPIDRLVRRVLLAGRWNDQHGGDRSVVAELAGMTYEDLRDRVEGLDPAGDPFVSRVDQSLGLVSPVDAWLLLRSSLRDDDLARFEGTVGTVLLALDPALELPPEDRWRAAAVGKARQHSRDLRRGIAASLALLGVHGDQVMPGGAATGTNWVARVVGNLLDRANRDRSCDTWSSLEDVLPLLAESAPDAFIDAVRAGVVGDPPVLSAVFQDSVDTGLFGSHSPHTGLLWALERLAWSPDHFGAAVDLLARLAEIDPGGRLGNRPFRSLENIFCPWHPDTAASLDQRIAALSALRLRHSQIAWRLMLSSLPEINGSHVISPGPAYRDWKPEKVDVPDPGLGPFTDRVAEWIVADVGQSAERWKDLIERLTRLPVRGREEALAALAILAESDALDHADRLALWNGLRKEIARHRHFSDAFWALPTAEVDALDAVASRLAPSDPERAHAWLFNDQRPDLGDPTMRDDFALYDQTLAERRRAAIVEIFTLSGLAGVRAFSEGVSQSWAIGVALADAGLPVGDDVLPLIEHGSDGERNLSHGYLTRRFSLEGWSWLTSVISSETLTPFQHAYVLLVSRDFPRAWEEATRAGSDVVDNFWRHFPLYGLGGDFEHAEHVAQELIKVGRPAAALHLLELYVPKDGRTEATYADMICAAMEAVLDRTEPDPELKGLSTYDFTTLFSYLQNCRDGVGLARLGHLEWAFLPALGFDARPDTLHQLMAAEPAFFLEIIKAVYRAHADTAGAAEVSSDEAARAENGYQVLRAWRC